ncbi:hypothetical protein [Enterococcus gallinarum]|uniref:hypothetical protein n=1 Tax=Enterococcus gallinarum TaxID=1353 RepID=UPI0035CA7BAD
MEYTIPGHLLKKIDLQHLKSFMKSEGLERQGTKEMLLQTLINMINDEEQIEEKDALVASYHNFLLQTIKYNNNRIVVTYPIITTKHSVYFSEKNLLAQFDTENLSELNYSNVINGDQLTRNEFNLIFQHIDCDHGEVKLIEICYGRINEYKREDQKMETFYEYIWCEIDPKKNQFRMIFSENPRAFIKNNSEGSRAKVQKEIEPKIRRKYNLVYGSNNERETLFKIYKYLTAHIEAPYQKKVEPYYNEISVFVTNVRRNLEISDEEDIQLENRIKKLFERNLIQKDFKHFRTKNVDDGRVQSVNYSDEVGGSVKATSGGSFFNGQLDQELDLQDSRVYFDIKESIYNDKELNSITVSWVNKSGLEDDRFDDIKVKYTACSGFYITHFMNIGVREEIYNYVLPKFDDYKRKPL